MSFLKDLERRYGSRGAEVRLLAVREVSRAADEKNGNGKADCCK
jgi:hypothetical protein